MMPLIYI